MKYKYKSYVTYQNEKQLDTSIEEHNKNTQDDFSSFFDLAIGEAIVCTTTGRVVVKQQDETVKIEYVDENIKWLHASMKRQIGSLQQQVMTSPNKIIERTAKRDGYDNALNYFRHFCRNYIERIPGLEQNTDLKRTMDSFEKLLREKSDSHTEFLKEQDLYWNIGMQTFVSRSAVKGEEVIQ